jgi:hypothetical protein
MAYNCDITRIAGGRAKKVSSWSIGKSWLQLPFVTDII